SASPSKSSTRSWAQVRPDQVPERGGRSVPIALFVFDIAGTTVDDADSVFACIKGALAAAGIETTRDEVNAVMGLPKPVAMARLVDRAGRRDLPEAQIRAIHDDFVARSIRYYHHDPGAREVPGASRVFQTLKGAGIRVALDTGFNRPITQVLLDRIGWSHSSL